MLGDVGDPQLIAHRTPEFAINSIFSSHDTRHIAEPGSSCERLDPSSSHQHLDGAMTDLMAASKRQLRTYATSSVSSSRIRRLADASSARSKLLRPGSNPESIRS